MVPTKEYGIMLDLETLGVDDDALITQIGAVVFDLKTGETFQKFNQNLDFIKTDAEFFNLYNHCLDIRKMDILERISNLDCIIEDIVENKCKNLCEKFKIEKGTLNFWLNSNSNLDILLEHLETKNNIDEYELMNQFSEFLIKSSNELSADLKIWGNGISFDIVKVKRKLAKHDIKYPISFYNERDVRTILELASLKANKNIYEIKDSVPKNNRQHDAFEDCIFQINFCHKCFEILMSE